jgi:hypothetical protein
LGFPKGWSQTSNHQPRLKCRPAHPGASRRSPAGTASPTSTLPQPGNRAERPSRAGDRTGPARLLGRGTMVGHPDPAASAQPEGRLDGQPA